MNIDKYELANHLTSCAMGFTRSILNGGNAGTIDKIILEIGVAALEFENAKRQKRKNNISPDTDLLIDQLDEHGRRRYTLACIDDEPCMLPDSGGFWTPVKDKHKLINKSQYIFGVNIGKDKNTTMATCLTCKNSIEIFDGVLPPIGWCGCDQVNRKEIMEELFKKYGIESWHDLLALAEKAFLEPEQSCDSKNWCTDVKFVVDGWKVFIFYDCGGLDYIAYFVTPCGVELDFWDWPEEHPWKRWLTAWGGVGCLDRLKKIERKEND